MTTTEDRIDALYRLEEGADRLIDCLGDRTAREQARKRMRAIVRAAAADVRKGIEPFEDPAALVADDLQDYFPYVSVYPDPTTTSGLGWTIDDDAMRADVVLCDHANGRYELPGGALYTVSDHGNPTLYGPEDATGERPEIWAFV